MKKNMFLILLLVVSVFMLTGCFDNENKTESPKTNNNNSITKESNGENNMEVSVTINGKSYKTILESNETAKAFLELLPQDFDMKELNGNEKYIYMDKSLPTNPTIPEHIVAGDIMLYGNDCLVIFYKSFNTSYSYTKIGNIDSLPDLGTGTVSIKFEK